MDNGDFNDIHIPIVPLQLSPIEYRQFKCLALEMADTIRDYYTRLINNEQEILRETESQ